MNFQILAPNFSETFVRSFIEENYSMKIEKATNLGSYDDQNFLIKTVKGEKYILKIANTREVFGLLSAQNEAMKHLNADESVKLDFPAPILSNKNEEIVKLIDEHKNIYLVRMLSYLEGTFLGDLENPNEELFSNFGENLALIDKSFQNFENPYFHREMEWDQRNALLVKDFYPSIKEAKRLKIVQHFILQFELKVIPVFHKLPMQIIHSDANEYNVLARNNKISGFIDFGDVIYTHRINELAIAIAYSLLLSPNILETAAQITKSYNKIIPLSELEISVLFPLIATRLAVSVSFSAEKQKNEPENEHVAMSEKPAWEALERLIKINPLYAENAFRKVCNLEVKQAAGLEKKELKTQRDKNLGKALSVSYNEPLKISSGLFQYLYDENGRAYLDTVNNVCHVGHTHPHVVDAAIAQISQLNTNTRYLHDNIVEYAKRLTATMPKNLSVCYFVNSGSEANELALRMAKTYTKAKDFITIEHAYHGNTNAVIEVSPYKFEGNGGSGKAQHIHKTIIPDTYRGKYRSGEGNIGKKYAKDVKNIIETEILAKNKKLAGFICESVQGVGGQVFLPDNYMRTAFDYVRKAGGVCIADEVQIGFGRIGTHFWAFQSQNAIPDIVTLGKPMGNGHPLAAVITTPEIAEAFNNGMEYFNTFGGNPVSCAIGMAVLDVIENEQLQQNALEVGSYLLEKLISLKEKHQLIGDVRGKGLFIGIELVKDHKTLEPAAEEASEISNLMKENGILTSVDGPLYNVIKFKPPICFTKENADFYVEVLDRVLAL